MSTPITSVANEHVKRVVALSQKSGERRREGLFVVEGVRELALCIDAGYHIVEVYRRNTEDERLDALLHMLPDDCRRFDVSPTVYAKMACRDSTEGVIAVVEARQRSLDDLDLGDNPLVMVVEQVEKPGNLGAILRSADAAGATAVLVCDPLTDLFNPNLIRNSLGAVFVVPVVTCTTSEAIAYLKSHGVRILTAQLQDSHHYYDIDMRVGVAIVMGTEATGLTEPWRRAADAHILIPMRGRVDSLNVSASAAILLYEAVRQRLTAEASNA